MPDETINKNDSSNSSESEDGKIISCREDQEDAVKLKELLRPPTRRAAVTKGLQIGTKNPRTLWHSAPIEIVGSLPSTLAVWEEYCEKFSSSSEESFLNLRHDEVDSIPLKRKIGFTDIRKVDANSEKSFVSTIVRQEEISSKYVRREQFPREDLVVMSEALIKFNDSITDVAGDIISYVQCLDT